MVFGLSLASMAYGRGRRAPRAPLPQRATMARTRTVVLLRDDGECLHFLQILHSHHTRAVSSHPLRRRLSGDPVSCRRQIMTSAYRLICTKRFLISTVDRASLDF